MRRCSGSTSSADPLSEHDCHGVALALHGQPVRLLGLFNSVTTNRFDKELTRLLARRDPLTCPVERVGKVPTMSDPLAVTLSGPHVTLTPLSLDDVDGLCRAASVDRATYGLTNVPATTEEMDSAVHALLDERDRRQGVPFATRLAATGEIVGMTRFLTLRWWFERDFPDAAEIGGTFLAASAQRTRVNTEAKLLMLTHAFDRWSVLRVDLKTDARNDRSRRAIERLGAGFEGVLRAWQPSLAPGEQGTARDSAMYSILPSQWPAVRTTLGGRLGDTETGRHVSP